MGKGDKKTRKGKIAIGSFGKVRPHDVKKAKAAEPLEKATKPDEKPEKPAEKPEKAKKPSA
jgi:30S ribosomal protein S31